VPCYHPQTAYRSKQGRQANGAWPIVFSVQDGYVDMPVVIPCGQCVGCRLERSRQWAVRCVHEAAMHDENCFITLTYNDNFIDKQKSLCKRDFVLFMKRLRKRYSTIDPLYEYNAHQIRFFHCGEYGDLLQRPHHHACLFGHDFPDKYLWSKRSGVNLYRSPSLEELWGYGFCTVGDVTFESAAYVARYVVKKITGKSAADHYAGREPEYVTMSRRPGIAAEWIGRYHDDVYPHDKVVVDRDLVCKPPRYYDKLFDRIGDLESQELERIKRKRVRDAQSSDDNDFDRLSIREQVQKLKAKKLIRKYETMEN